jgi:hypothetical protein
MGDGEMSIKPPTIGEFLAAANATYSRDVPPDLQPFKDSAGNQITSVADWLGFYGETFIDQNGNIIVAYEGTSQNNALYAAGTAFVDAALAADVLDPLSVAAPVLPAFIDAADLIKLVVQAGGGGDSHPIYITGHSLGGTEAEYAASVSPEVVGGITFGATGVPGYIGLGGESNSSNFFDYVEHRDPVGHTDSPWMQHYGTVAKIGPLGLFDLSYHNLPRQYATDLADVTSPFEPQSTLPVSIGGTATIAKSFLWSFDPDNTADELTYTVITAPSHGAILLNGLAAPSFTQADIDNGQVTYVENGDFAGGDSFTFQVSDPAGNHTPTDPFRIAILDQAGPVVTTNESLSASVGGSAPLSPFLLDTVSLDNTPDQLIYQLTAAPQHGALLVGGAAFPLFTQSDIDNSRVQYVNSGDGATSDSFAFVAWDSSADWTAGSFNIAIQPNGAIGNSAASHSAAGGSNAGGWQRSVPDGYQMVGIGDFHGNGASDILLRNPTSGDVAELRSDQGMNFSDIGWAEPGWEVAGTADLNGDGTTDIVFDFPGSGAAGAFIMNDGHPAWVTLGSTTAA